MYFLIFRVATWGEGTGRAGRGRRNQKSTFATDEHARWLVATDELMQTADRQLARRERETVYEKGGRRELLEKERRSQMRKISDEKGGGVNSLRARREEEERRKEGIP